MLEYWWILPPLMYAVLIIILIRRGMWEGAGRNTVLAVSCVLILLVPTMDPPTSFVIAVLIVISLLTLELGKWLNQKNSDGPLPRPGRGEQRPPSRRRQS